MGHFLYSFLPSLQGQSFYYIPTNLPRSYWQHARLPTHLPHNTSQSHCSKQHQPQKDIYSQFQHEFTKVMMRVKICGITKPDQGRAIVHMGATALGFICVRQSPRYVSPEQIRAVVDALPTTTAIGQRLNCIGVFADATLSTICQTAAIAALSGIQLHGRETPEFCVQLRQNLPSIEIIKTIRVRDPTVLSQAAIYADCANTLLLDA